MRIRLTYIVIIVGVVAVAAIGGYLTLQTPPQPAPLQRQQEVIADKFTAVSPPLPAPATIFTGPDGKKIKIADFHGRWLLVNLWATWCGPCMREMPSLARMNDALKPELDVIAISEDRKGAAAVDPFKTTLGLKTLAIGLDPAGNVAGALHVDGLPSTFLIDPQSRIVARLDGPADWDSPRTVAALNELMGKPAR